MKRFLLLATMLLFGILSSACNYASEQGTVSVEVTQGKVVKVHEPGETYTTFGPYTTGYEVDLRNHMDGVDIQGVTTDNAPFYMKIDVVYHPLHVPNAGPDNDPLVKYLSAFGFEADPRSARRWGVLAQLVKNAARDATSGKYDAYALRAKQAEFLAAIQTELAEKFKNELFCEVVSVGMEIQPQFNDPRIDQAANAVVAAKKEQEAQQALKAAAQTRLEKEQIQNQIYTSSPQAYQLALLDKQKDIAQAWSAHQGTLIFGSGTSFQLQVPTGGK